MSDYEIGYKKPPLHTRFKKGVSPNPKGRGKHKALEAGQIYNGVINAHTEVAHGGKITRVPRMELIARRKAAEAIKGSVRSAEELLDLLISAKRNGDFEIPTVELSAGEFWARSQKKR